MSGELLDQTRARRAVRDRLVALKPAAHASQGRQVDLDHLLDVRALHLDDDVGEAQLRGVGLAQPGAVGLAQ